MRVNEKTHTRVAQLARVLGKLSDEGVLALTAPTLPQSQFYEPCETGNDTATVDMDRVGRPTGHVDAAALERGSTLLPSGPR